MATSKYLLLFSFCLVLHGFVLAQPDPKQDSLLAQLNSAHTPTQQVNAYYAWAANIFSINQKKSDSLAFVGLAVAEASRERALLVQAYLKDGYRYLLNTAKKSNVEGARSRAQKALSISQIEKNSELIVQCDILLARTYRINGEISKAIQFNSDAIGLLNEIHNDSLSVYAYNSLGLSLVNKNDMVNAFKAYLGALTVAEKSMKPGLLILCYERLMDFYQSLNNFEKAKDYAFKILQLNAKTKNKSLAMHDYHRIAGVYAAAKELEMSKYYYDKSAHLADSLHNADYKIEVKLGLINMYINNNHFKDGYEMIRQSPEIFAYIKNAGMGYEIDKANGYVQMMLGHYDSSIFYYKRAEPFYLTSATPFQKFFFYAQFSMLFKTMKQWDKAIDYQLKAKQAIEATSNIELLSKSVHTLDSLYLQKKDFTTAYHYFSQYETLRDSLQKLSKEKDLQSLEIDNENKRKERAQLQADEELRRRHNLQYMAITVAIGAIFILLVALGLFKVSPNVVKAIGFFAFIFLFEFIILIADNQIHHLTHGEPWKVLLIKIALVAMLLPLHHWLEEKVIHYLIEKRLVLSQRLRQMVTAQKQEDRKNE